MGVYAVLISFHILTLVMRGLWLYGMALGVQQGGFFGLLRPGMVVMRTPTKQPSACLFLYYHSENTSKMCYKVFQLIWIHFKVL